MFVEWNNRTFHIYSDCVFPYACGMEKLRTFDSIYILIVCLCLWNGTNRLHIKTFDFTYILAVFTYFTNRLLLHIVYPPILNPRPLFLLPLLAEQITPHYRPRLTRRRSDRLQIPLRYSGPALLLSRRGKKVIFPSRSTAPTVKPGS